jgi:hypothetical protein
VIISLYKVFNPNTQDWSDVYASSVASFLEEHHWALREKLLSSSVDLLKSYRLRGFPQSNTVPILLGLCRLEIEDSSELKETIETLEDALKLF